MRRPVRIPPSRETTAPISSSVCSEPFMSIWTSPLRASSTARTAAARLLAISTIATPLKSSSKCLGQAADLALPSPPDGNDQLVLVGLHGSAERYFVAGPCNGRPHRWLGVRARNHPVVAAIRIVDDQLGHGQGGPAQLRHRAQSAGPCR